MSFLAPHSVMLIAGASGLHTGRYRVDHKIEMGNILGLRTTVHDFTDLSGAFKDIEQADLVIVHRAAHHQALEDLIIKAHELRKVVAFDIDDLIFDERDLKYVKATRNWPPDEVAAFRDGFRRYRKTLELCDVAITSTEYLARRIEQDFGISSLLLRYNLCRELIRISQRARSEARKPEEPFRLGYFAGSPVHDWNFKVASEAISRTLKENPSAQLLIGGYLNLAHEFERLDSQILRSPFVPWKELPYIMAQCDVILAPLEWNPHNRSKAETKYIESGILGIPLVASPLDSFKLCIRDGENGYLAQDSDEWYDKINLLVKNRKLLMAIGAKAKGHVLRNYTPEVRAKDYYRILESLLRMRKIRSRRFPVDYVTSLHNTIPLGRMTSSTHTTIAYPFSRSLRLVKQAFWVWRHEGFDALLAASLRKIGLISQPQTSEASQLRISKQSRSECPVCRAGSYSKAFTVTSIFESGAKLDYVSCDICGTIYRKTPGALDYVSIEFYPKKAYLERHLGHPFFAFVLSNLNRYVSLHRPMEPRSTAGRFFWGVKSKTRALVEVGCATGLFLDMARYSGWRVKGVEPNKNYADWARRSLGLDVVTGNLESTRLKQRFDAVVALEVVEHSADPVVFLGGLMRLLGDDGILLLTTPNSRSKEFAGADPTQLTDGGAHTTILNEDSARILLEKSGALSVVVRKAEGVHGDQRLILLASKRPRVNLEGLFSVRGAFEDNFATKFLESYLQNFLERTIGEESLRLAALYRLCEISGSRNDFAGAEKVSREALAGLSKLGFSQSELDGLAIDKKIGRIASGVASEFPSFLPDLLNVRGIALLKLGRPREAGRSFEQAFALLRDLRNRRQAHVTWGDQELLAYSLLRVGLAKLNNGNNVEAARIMERALQDFPRASPNLRAEILFNRGISLMNSKNYEEALLEFGKMSQLGDEKSERLFVRALTELLRQKKFRD